MNRKLYKHEDNAFGRLNAGISAGTLTIPLQSGQGALLPVTANGAATSLGSSTVLNDTGIQAALTAGGFGVGDIIENVTDGSYAIIKSISTNSITTTRLKGGSDNTWENSDVWAVNRFIVTLVKYDADGETVLQREKVLIESRSGDNLTVNASGRGFDGSTAASFATGDYAYLFMTSSAIDGIQQAIAQAFLDADAAVDTLATVAYLAATNVWTGVQSFTADLLQITTDANSANDPVRYSQALSLVGSPASIVTGEAINGSTTPQIVCIKAADGLLYKAKADDATLTMAIGFVSSNALITTTPTIVSTGIIGGFTGLIQNATYYVSDTAGAISPTQSATCTIPVGRAISTTQLQISFGKRIATGSINHPSAGTGTQDVTTQIGFRPSVVILGISAAITGSSSTGNTRATAHYYGTTLIGGAGFNEDDIDNSTLTESNIALTADYGINAGGARARSGGGNNAVIEVKLNAIAATSITTRVTNTLAAGAGGLSSGTITYIAFE